MRFCVMDELKQKSGIEGRLPGVESQSVFKVIVKVFLRRFHPQMGADKRRCFGAR